LSEPGFSGLKDFQDFGLTRFMGILLSMGKTEIRKSPESGAGYRPVPSLKYILILNRNEMITWMP
jgi:hypothetical protein